MISHRPPPDQTFFSSYTHELYWLQVDQMQNLKFQLVSDACVRSNGCCLLEPLHADCIETAGHKGFHTVILFVQLHE